MCHSIFCTRMNTSQPPLPFFPIVMLVYKMWVIFQVSDNLGMRFQLSSFKVSWASRANLQCETITNSGVKHYVIKRSLVNKTICNYHWSQIGPRVYSSALGHKQSIPKSVYRVKNVILLSTNKAEGQTYRLQYDNMFQLS